MNSPEKYDIMRKVTLAVIWVYIFTVPWDHSLMFEGLGPISRVVTICTLPLGVVAVAVTGKMRKLRRVHIVMVAFLLLVQATMFWSVDLNATLTAIRAYVQMMVIAWLVWEFAPSQDSLRKLAGAYMIGCYVSVANILRDFLFNTSTAVNSTERFSADGWNQNDLAVVLALGILLARYASTGTSKFVKVIAFVYAPMACISIALTGSRGGSIVAAIAVLGLAVQWDGRIVLKIASLVMLAAAVYVGLTYVPASTVARITSLAESTGDLGSRVPVWQIALMYFPEHPFFGVGASAFGTATHTDMVAHNTFLSILMEEGLAGFTVFAAIVVLLFRTAWNSNSSVRLVCVILLICWVVAVCSLTWEQSRVTWVVFGLVAAQLDSRASCDINLLEYRQNRAYV